MEGEFKDQRQIDQDYEDCLYTRLETYFGFFYEEEKNILYR